MVPDTASLRSYVPTSRPDKPISCLVCSDKSFGNNFGAITCESCKAFFRRTANERDKLACPFNDNCEITIATRKHCRKCRLEKCFAVGMIKEWIQSEEQLKIRRAILKERKLRREMSTSGQTTKRFKPNPSSFGGSGGGGSSISGSSNSCSPNIGTNNERLGSNWSRSNVNGQSLDGSRVNGQWQSVASTSVNINPNDKKIDNNRQSVAQFFNKISDQNFFAHLVKANETPTRSSIKSSPIQRSSVITFTGKSSASSSPSLSIASSPEQVTQDVCDLDSKSANESMKGDSLTNSNYDPDCLPVYQNLVNKQELIPSGSYVTLSSSSSFTITAPEVEAIKKPIAPTAPSPLSISSTPLLLPSSSSSSSSSSSFIDQNQMKTPEPSLSKQSKSWVTEEIDKKVDNFVKPTTSTLPSSSTSSTSSLSSESSKSVSLNVFHHIIDSYFTRINMRNERQMVTLALNSMEETRLIELTLAYGVFNEPLVCPTTISDNLLVDCYNISVGYLLSMTKKLTTYAELPVEDQISLLRGTFADILAMRGTFLFDLDRLFWPIKGTNMTVKFEALLPFDESFYNNYLDFMKNLNPVWRNNVIINQLIVVIMLFNCNLSDLKSPEAIRLEHCAYIYLLQRYLESSLNFRDQPKETLCHILSKINQLKSINRNLVRLSINNQSVSDIKIGSLESLLTPD